MSLTKRVIAISIFSRLFLLSNMLLMNWFLPSFDVSVPFETNLPFLRWDSVHFESIATFGYQHEMQFAFFPLLPFLLRVFALVCGRKIGFLLGIGAVNLAFIVSTVVFFK